MKRITGNGSQQLEKGCGVTKAGLQHYLAIRASIYQWPYNLSSR